MATSITSNETVTKLLDTNANPAPLGLMGFALTTILLNIHNAGFFELNSIILAIGLWYGGIAQLIAGIMEWKKNNTFGTLAFTSYGAFWITLVFIWILPEVFPDLAAAQAPTLAAMGYFLLAWGIFTAYMFVATLRLNRALQVVFGLLTLLFLLLAIRDFTGNETVGIVAGYVGIRHRARRSRTLPPPRSSTKPTGGCCCPSAPSATCPKAFVSDYGEEIAQMWLDDIRRSPQTTAYAVVPDQDLVNASEFALSQVDEYFTGD